MAVGCLSRSFAWAVVIFAARQLFADGWLLRGGDRIFRYVFGRSPWNVAESAASILAILWLLLALLQAILGDRAHVLESYGKVLLWAAKAAKAVILGAFKLAWYAVEGLPANPERRKRAGGSREVGNGR